MTTKGIVLFFLFLSGIGALLSALLEWNVFGFESKRGALGFAVGIAMLAAGIMVWKKWEE